MGTDDNNNNSGNRLPFGANPSQPTFLNPFNTNRQSSEMTSYRPYCTGIGFVNERRNRIGTAPFSSPFSFTGGPFLPPSSTQSTNTNSPFTDSATTFGSIS